MVVFTCRTVSEDLYVLFCRWESKSTFNWCADVNNARVQGNSGKIAAAAINQLSPESKLIISRSLVEVHIEELFVL